METHTIFFVGKPGCGKGTQAKLLAEKTGWKVVTAGEQFRSIIAEDTPVGLKMRSDVNAGLLAPDWFASYLFLQSLFSLSSDTSVIFDGFNRKIPEAELALEALSWVGRSFVVLHLAVSDEEIKHRLALRKDIESRADDSAVDTRLEEYNTYTSPVIELFRKTGILLEVNGEQTPEAIAEDIAKVLNLQ